MLLIFVLSAEPVRRLDRPRAGQLERADGPLGAVCLGSLARPSMENVNFHKIRGKAANLSALMAKVKAMEIVPDES